MEKTTRKSRKKTVIGSSGSSNFIIQGSILAIAGIIVRLIGMLYRIPLAEKIGDEGIGYYSSAYSVYSILLIMSSYSLPVAVSKMVAARLANHQYRNAERILRASLFYATIVGAIGAAALWFGADLFADAIKMPYSSYALRTLAPTIWIMAYLGVLRGYFQGHSTMVPTAVSQVFEQVVNAVISILAAGALFQMGTVSNLVYESAEYSYAFGAAGGTIGTG
ncbi:MAG: oligosaccharide flippase family protein, partial [Hungatella sp.]